ncbi:MAG TPA: hypothetical protein VGE83_08110 [Terracidiphilus sp.]|jgi:hypothetical protein
MIAMCLGVWTTGTGVAAGQARVIGQRESEIAPFAQATYMHPDYSQPANLGYTGGVDATPFMFRGLQLALELRFTGDSGSIAHEYTCSGGLKAATTFHGIRPYATLLRGLDIIYFTNPIATPKGPYARDSSRMFSVGGGAEFDVGPSWQVVVDYSKQYWALDSPLIRPVAFSLGVAYRIPFRHGKMKD